MTGGENNTEIDCVLWTDDVTIMTSLSKKNLCMFKIKLPTKRIFRIFHILRINGMVPFCNLFMERPSYFIISHHPVVFLCYLMIISAELKQRRSCYWFQGRRQSFRPGWANILLYLHT